MTEIDKFYAKGINLYTTLFTHDNGLNLARSATHGSLVLISDYLNETVRIDKPNQQLVSSVFTGWGNGGRFVITDNSPHNKRSSCNDWVSISSIRIKPI